MGLMQLLVKSGLFWEEHPHFTTEIAPEETHRDLEMIEEMT